MKNNFWLLLVVVLSMFAVSHALAVGKVTVDPNAAPKVVAPAPVAVGAADKRFDQKITFDAPNARLHDVVATIAEKSGITIFCGSSPDDWRVRDIPVTVAAREITLRKLLEYLLFSTHTYLKETKTDKGIIYRIKRDARLQKMLDDYEKALEDYKTARLKWSLEAACKLKDIPVSEIKPPQGVSPDWGFSMATQREASKLLAALDSDTKARILAGEALILSPRTAPAGLREIILGYLRVADAKSINDIKDMSYISYSSDSSLDLRTSIRIRNGKPATSGELEDARLRLIMNNKDITINGMIRVQEDEYYSNRSSYDSVSQIAYTTSSNNKGRLSLPKEPTYPKDPKMEPSNKDLKSLWEGEDLQKKVTLKFEETKDKKPVYSAEALIALSKETGMSIVCEDFQTHREDNDLRSSFTSESTIVNALQRALSVNWLADGKEKALVGYEYSWPTQHRNLMPERIIDNLTNKGNGDGIDLDDLASLSVFTSEAVSSWVNHKNFPNLQYYPFTQPENRQIWMFYDSLSASNKALAKSKDGIAIGNYDLKPILEWLKERARTDSAAMYQPDSPEPSWKRLADPSVLPSLVLRIEINEASSGLFLSAESSISDKRSEMNILVGFAKRHNCTLMIEGFVGKEKISLRVDGGYNLPYFLPEREKQLAEALKKQSEAANK
ncbi:MAG: hypothetical protein NT018_10070 [Armatimonadetes bacterium]|nr:hypothetical protein [Armatimonadota bacterium]